MVEREREEQRDFREFALAAIYGLSPCFLFLSRASPGFRMPHSLLQTILEDARDEGVNIPRFSEQDYKARKREEEKESEQGRRKKEE